MRPADNPVRGLRKHNMSSVTKKKTGKARKGRKLIFRAYKTLPDGTKLWAKDFGYKAWPIWA